MEIESEMCSWKIYGLDVRIYNSNLSGMALSVFQLYNATSSCKIINVMVLNSSIHFLNITHGFLNMTNVYIMNNILPFTYPRVIFVYKSVVFLKDCAFWNNHIVGKPISSDGAIMSSSVISIYGSFLTILNCTFHSNVKILPLALNYSYGTIINSTFYNNTLAPAIVTLGYSEVQFRSCYFISNTVYGGVLFIEHNSEINIQSSNFEHNNHINQSQMLGVANTRTKKYRPSSNKFLVYK